MPDACKTSPKVTRRAKTAYGVSSDGDLIPLDSARIILGKMEGQRRAFTGTFARYGKKSAFRGPDLRTILLSDITTGDTARQVADHLWFPEGKLWLALGPMVPGDRIQFVARVEQYEKGYSGCRDDVIRMPELSWKLSRCTNIVKTAPQQEITQ